MGLAIIYGSPETEKDLLSQSPNSISKFEDIEPVHQKLKEKLSKDKKEFFEKLPSKIKEEEAELEKIKNHEKITIQKYDEKIKKLENKKAKGGFSSISASLKITFLKNFSKRREINKIKKSEKKQQENITEWKENPEGIFNKSQIDKINEIKHIDEIKKSPYHAGAKGELQVLEKLSQLSDDYHVLCGLNIGLGRYVTYNRKKNLRSAQMDYVVVSRKGIILIEVKNWSNQYFKSHNGLNPYEQTDRAGRVLWIWLQGWWSGPRVTNVLLSIQNNMQYNQRYRAVFVSNLEKIKYFLENRTEVLSDGDVRKIVGKLQGHVTQ